MRKISLDQGSHEWLSWRKKLLTATDAPMLLGISPYVTPYQGWQRKHDLIEEQKCTFAMDEGKRNEPKARDLFVQQSGINFSPVVIESDEYNFLGASLDGMSDCGRYILEIKCNGKERHESRVIPDFHMAQMQHQLLTTDKTVEKCIYVSFYQGEIIVTDVYPNQDWMYDYLEKAKAYWKKVIFFEPPALTDSDYKDMSNEPNWYSFANEYRRVSEQIKQLEDVKESYRNEIIKLCGSNSCLGNGIKVLKKSIKGTVDYKSIPELAKIDLEKYRKPGSHCWTILLDK